MAEQQQMSSFAQRLGGRVAAANAEHRDKPIDLGNRRLPPGIRNGVAKISALYTKDQTEDNGMVPKGQCFFRGSAIVMSPEAHNGEKVSGGITQVLIPLCDVPAKGQRKESTFSENWYEFQNLFKLLGIAPPTYTQQTDPTGQLTEAYYFAAMKVLTDPKRPVYISFSTRGWTPPPSAQQPKPNEMVFETWHGLAQAPSNGQPHDPAAGVMIVPSMPPTQAVIPFNEFAPPSKTQAVQTKPTELIADPKDEGDDAYNIGVLVQTAMDDPEGATEEGMYASSQLEERAWTNGWTKEQTGSAENWAAVGEMCLRPPNGVVGTVAPTFTDGHTIGSVWKFAKRTKDGARLKNNKGEEFPPQYVRITAMDVASNTCLVESVKDGKPVVDIRTKQPISVKFEWLEPA